MKVRVKYQAYYAVDSRGPRIIEPGTVISVPDDIKLANWMELVDEPKAVEADAEPKRKVRPNAESVL